MIQFLLLGFFIKIFSIYGQNALVVLVGDSFGSVPDGVHLYYAFALSSSRKKRKEKEIRVHRLYSFLL